MNDSRMRIREIGDMLLLLMGYTGSMCSSSESCVGKNYGIEHDGKVFHCDKFSRDDSYCFGNLSVLDFNQLPDWPKGIALKKLELGCQ
jgi:sulfatase maturation enzyme AslB (radical SAM superfamily)